MKPSNTQTAANSKLQTKIVSATLLWGALLYIFVALAILCVSWLYLKSEYEDFLSRVTHDFIQEYAPGNAAKLFQDDIEEHGADRVYLLLAAPDGSERLAACADERIREALVRVAHGPSAKGRISRSPDSRHANRVIARYLATPLADGSRLIVAHNVTLDEYYLIFLAAALAVALVFMLALGALAANSLARRLVRDLKNISNAASRIRSGDWTVRVSPSRETIELAALGETFNMMCDANEKYVSELKTLTGDIAHDLRTPLTRLYAAAENADSADLRGIVAEQTRNMLEIINTMLEISRASCRAAELPGEEIDLAAFVRSMADLYSTVAEDSRLQLSATAADGENVIVRANKSHLQRLLGNLLDNAIKHTPAGGKVEITARRDGANAILEVSDTGCGIAPDDMPHIFKRFWRADSSRSLPGNGLGLSLVKAIAEAYGGSVSCSSAPGRGTTFTVRFRG